jgi:hypothetical protein
MGGHYVPMDHELPDKPEVAGIFRKTGCEIDLICGRLFLFWSLADRQCVAGILQNFCINMLCRKCGGDEEFWRAVESVGWLEVTDDGIAVPNFEARFGKSARERRGSAERKQHQRDRERDTCVTHVTPERDQSVTPRTVTETVTINPGTGALKKPVGSVMRSISPNDLKDTTRLLALFPEASEDDRLFILGAAERALELGKKPVAMFVKFIRDNDRKLISGKQADRAAARLRTARDPPSTGHYTAALAKSRQQPG